MEESVADTIKMIFLNKILSDYRAEPTNPRNVYFLNVLYIVIQRISIEKERG